MTAVPPRPAAPDTDTGALREALAKVLSTWVIGVAHENSWLCADVLLNVPLRDLIAERDQAVAAVQRVRILLPLIDDEGSVSVRHIRRALAGDL